MTAVWVLSLGLQAPGRAASALTCRVLSSPRLDMQERVGSHWPSHCPEGSSVCLSLCETTGSPSCLKSPRACQTYSGIRITCELGLHAFGLCAFQASISLNPYFLFSPPHSPKCFRAFSLLGTHQLASAALLSSKEPWI